MPRIKYYIMYLVLSASTSDSVPCEHKQLVFEQALTWVLALLLLVVS